MPVAEAPAHPAPAHREPAHHARPRWDRVERSVFRAVNRTRSRHGLPRLRLVASISQVAGAHSRDMAAHRPLSHSSSDGTPFHTRIRRVANARTVGETIIEYHGRSTGRQIVGAWLRSPPHRAQLLAAPYRRVGIGRASTRGKSIVTADFATSR